MFAMLPVIRLSIPITRWPSASRRSVRCEPRNPAPPVTTEIGCGFAGIAKQYLRAGDRIARRFLRRAPADANARLAARSDPQASALSVTWHKGVYTACPSPFASLFPSQLAPVNAATAPFGPTSTSPAQDSYPPACIDHQEFTSRRAQSAGYRWPYSPREGADRISGATAPLTA